MNPDPIRDLAARRQVVRYQLPDGFAPTEPEPPIPVEALTPGTGPVRTPQTAADAFRQLLTDARAGTYGA